MLTCSRPLENLFHLPSLTFLVCKIEMTVTTKFLVRVKWDSQWRFLAQCLMRMVLHCIGPFPFFLFQFAPLWLWYTFPTSFWTFTIPARKLDITNDLWPQSVRQSLAQVSLLAHVWLFHEHTHELRGWCLEQFLYLQKELDPKSWFFSVQQLYDYWKQWPVWPPQIPTVVAGSARVGVDFMLCPGIYPFNSSSIMQVLKW